MMYSIVKNNWNTRPQNIKGKTTWVGCFGASQILAAMKTNIKHYLMGGGSSVSTKSSLMNKFDSLQKFNKV